MDNLLPVLSFFSMAQPDELKSMTKFTSPASLVVDLVVVGAFFIYMFFVLRTHVPSNDPKMITIWGLISSSCLTGVFWLAVQMFRVVYRAFREQQK